MDDAAMCVEILKRIVAICNEGKVVSFEEDLGGNTLTIRVDDAHTHAGAGDDFDVLVSNVYNSLHGGPGLSWAKG